MNYRNNANIISSFRFCLTYYASIVIAGWVVLTEAKAQSLDDWKAALSAASSGRGSESIPYSGYREDVKSKQSLVEEFCKNESWSCDSLGTKALREEIKGRSYKIEEMKKQRERLSSDKSSAKTEDEKRKIQDRLDSMAKEIDNAGRELEFKQKSLETDLKDIDIRINKGQKCLDARVAVQRAFKDAIDKAKNENDSAIKPIANQLIAYWEKRQQEHKEAFEVTRSGIEKCGRCKSGDL
jgi:hypothetical protein